MKKIELWLFALTFSFMVSCNNQDTINESLRQFSGTKVELDTLENQIKNELYKKDAAWKLFIYNDSTECSSCRLRELDEWKPLLKKLKERNIESVFIFSPKKDNKDVFDFVVKSKLDDANIIIDQTGYFRKINPALPNNTLLHIFLVDKKGSVVVIGNPLRNQKVLDLMLNMINTPNNRR